MKQLLTALAILWCVPGLQAQEGTFTDPRDGQQYKTVQIGDQVWMAENLNYKMENSWCYDDDPDNCEVYGRLYNREADMNACPEGWHLPTTKEWFETMNELHMESMDKDVDWNVIRTDFDRFNWKGFNISLSGSFTLSDGFVGMSETISYWTSDEEFFDGKSARLEFRIGYEMGEEIVNLKQIISTVTNGYSVRCVKD